MLVGEVVHQKILHWIRSYQHHRPFQLAEIFEQTWQAFLRRYEFSQRECYFYHPASDPRFTILFEHVYKQPVSTNTLGDIYQMIKRAFRNLSVWKGFQRLHILSPNRVMYQDELLQVELDGLPLWIKVDYGYRELNTQPILIDWKLSRQPEKKDPLQLAVYGAFTYQHRKDGTPIRLINFYLLTGQAVEFYLDDALFQNTVAFIHHSYQQMQNFHQKVADGLRFTNILPAYQRANCRFCNFQKICFPGGISLEDIEPMPAILPKSILINKEGR